MSNAKQLNAYLLEQLAPLGAVRSRAMMGGYLFYLREKLFGGVYGPGFMVKPTEAGRVLEPECELLPPYEGAKPMMLVDFIDDRERLCALAEITAEALPEPPPKKPKAPKAPKMKSL